MFLLYETCILQEVLPGALEDAGIALQRLVTYTTVEHRQLHTMLNTILHVDVVVFFSPSGRFLIFLQMTRMAGACLLRQNILGEDLKFEACFGFKRRRCGGLGGNFFCLWTTRPGFESRHGASPQCSLREAADRTVNTVQIKYKYPRPRRRIQEKRVARVGVMS